jgi:hypothetical protein
MMGKTKKSIRSFGRETSWKAVTRKIKGLEI